MDSEIYQNENRLSIKLPNCLKEYYRQLGNHHFNQTQDKLFLPQKLYFEDDRLIFYSENQSFAIWGINRKDLNLENPPVFISFEKNTWTFENDLMSFLISMAYLQAIFAFPFNANAIGISSETEKRIKTDWKKTKNTLKIWDSEFYQNSFDEVLAILKSVNQLDFFVATKTEKDLKNIDKKLNLTWDFNSLKD